MYELIGTLKILAQTFYENVILTAQLVNPFRKITLCKNYVNPFYKIYILTNIALNKIYNLHSLRKTPPNLRESKYYMLKFLS